MFKCGIELLSKCIFKWPRNNCGTKPSRLFVLFSSDDTDQLVKCKAKRKNPFDSDTESPEKKKYFS